MEFQQRDIVLVHFPFTNLTQTKLRPALIISSSQVNKMADFVCVQITSRPFPISRISLLKKICLMVLCY